MSIDKNWVKTGESNYTFFVDGNAAGQLGIDLSTTNIKAVALIGKYTYDIKRIGFWKTNIEITDDSGQVIMKVYTKKWYANTSVLEYNGKQYQLVIRNNPLAEWAILDNEMEYLAYGLSTENGTVKIKITSAFATNDLLPDFLLWYLFAPIAQENTGGNFVFQVLLAAH
jgi:hypothetical protein